MKRKIMNTRYFSIDQAPISLNRFSTINQTQPSVNVSPKYRFIPTFEALEVFADFGWFPINVVEATTRIPENRGYQKHCVRLASSRMNQELEVGTTVPNILLVNSHAGTSCFELHLALLEKVCSNGLVIERSNTQQFRILHKGYTDNSVAYAINSIVPDISQILTQTEKFKHITLDQDERRLLADAAVDLKFDGEQYAINPSELLYARRSSQREPTLWNTFNVIQEAILQGGVRQIRRDGSRVRSRQVKSIDENIRLNKALWRLTEKFAELKLNA
jgi:Domain of unknown function (DUF932)